MRPLAALARARQATAEFTPERAATLAITLSVAAGLLLRARGYLWGQSGFWLDEASWALRLFSRSLVDSWVRPVGFLALSKALATVLSPSEFVLRAVPWCAGVAALLLAGALSRRLFAEPAARVLFVAMLAFHPAAIDLAKEFKPYSLSLALHLGLVLATLRYTERAGGGALSWALGLALIGCPLSQDLVMAYPGAFLVLAWRAKRAGRRDLALVIGAALLIVSLLLVQYLVIWRHRPGDSVEAWGDRYDVFFVGQLGRSQLGWAVERYLDLAATPGLRRLLWHSDAFSPDQVLALRSGDRLLWLWLHVLGVWLLAAERHRRDALLVVLPLAVLCAFNAAGYWPLGAFRTNLFALAYAGAIAARAFDGPWARSSPWLSLGVAVGIVALPLAFFERDWGKHKRMFTDQSSFPALVEQLGRVAPTVASARDTVILDEHSCDLWTYYTTVHPTLSRELGPRLRVAFDARCTGEERRDLAELLHPVAPARRTWLVLSAPGLLTGLRQEERLNDLDVIGDFDYGSHRLTGFAGRP